MRDVLIDNSLASVAELGSNPGSLPILDSPIQAEVHGVDGETLYTVTWPGLELGSTALFEVLDRASPVPGSESSRQVVTNFRGVHEPANRSVIEVHRQIFDEPWTDMAHSRRLLWTVLDGAPQQRLSYDDSIFYSYAHTQLETLTGRDETAGSLQTAAMLAEVVYVKSQSSDDRFMSEIDTSGFEDLFAAYSDAVLGTGDDDGFDSYFRTLHLSNAWVKAHIDKDGTREKVSNALEQALQDADPTQVDAMLDSLYNTFVDDDGETHYVSIRVRGEEPIPLQAMYHQRLPISLYHDHGYYDSTPRWFESYSGLDHTYFTAIQGSSGEKPEYGDDGAHSVRPVLAWKTSGDGTRAHVRNFELPQNMRTSDKGAEGISYTDTTTGLVLAALANPDIRQKWPKSSRLPKGTVESDSRFELVPGERQIPMGPAQTPLLALLSGDDIRGTQLFDRLENLAETS